MLPSPPHRWFTVCRLRFIASPRLRDWSITSNRETSTNEKNFGFFSVSEKQKERHIMNSLSGSLANFPQLV